MEILIKRNHLSSPRKCGQEDRRRKSETCNKRVARKIAAVKVLTTLIFFFFSSKRFLTFFRPFSSPLHLITALTDVFPPRAVNWFHFLLIPSNLMPSTCFNFSGAFGCCYFLSSFVIIFHEWEAGSKFYRSILQLNEKKLIFYV